MIEARARAKITVWLRRGTMATALSVAAALASGCFFLRVSAKNAAIVLRAPDPVSNRITHPRRANARLAALWVGHSTVLLQLDDRFILTDPIFTDFVGTVSHRLVEPGILPNDLPLLDVVLVSHRHYDHLSPASIELIGSRVRTLLVPEAAAADIPPGPYDVHELAWWNTWESRGLRITAVPVQHEGSRGLDGSSHPRSFTGYVIEYHGLVVYFPGDTAYRASIFRDVAQYFHRIDLALLPICPMTPRDEMQPTHMDPNQAFQAGLELHARMMIPIHYDTFIDSDDAVGECSGRLAQVTAGHPDTSMQVITLRIGEERTLVSLLGTAEPAGRHAGPAAEGATERTDVREPEHQRDLDDGGAALSK